MFKKIKILLAGFLTVSCLMAFNLNNTGRADSLTLAQNETKNISLLAEAGAAANIEEGYNKVAENDALELYVKEANLGLKIKNKATGYVWSSTLDAKDENLNNTWQAFAESAVTVEYVDNKNKVRQLSLTKEKAEIKLNKKESGFTADINFKRQGIKLTIEVTLDKDSISVKVPYTSIEESDETYKIQSLILYPFFGATKNQEASGDMFIPDGSGALIKLDQKTTATQPYSARVYGDDLGIRGIPKGDVTDNSVPPSQAYMSVFGMNHENKNAYVASVEGGSPYSVIQAYPAGVTTVYNWVTAKFIYRESYFKPVDKKGNGITVNQEKKNTFDASIRYMFLAEKDANYVGMAKRYQKQLVDNKVLSKLNGDENKDVPVRLEFFAAESKKQFLWKKIIPMTTAKQIDDILKDLNNNKLSSMTVIVNGWTKGGASGASPTHFPFENKVGSKNDWISLVKKYGEKGIPVYMYTDYMHAFNGKGYKKSDIAQSISEQFLSFGNYAHFLNPNSSLNIFKKELNKFNSYGMKNIALYSIGSNLYSAYNDKSTLSRIDAIKTYEEMFANNNENKFALYSPNDYLWKYADEYFDIPMDSSKFVVETEAVPFMQIVLKGYINYYAPASNFNADKTSRLLKMIDYAALPSFYLTHEDPVKFLDTNTEWIYTSQYSVWKDEILREYEEANKALKPVKNAAIEDRSTLREGVVKNTYSNGVSIIVNYTKESYNYNDVTVPAENFVVIGGTR